jgi:hypothetical protein
MAGLLDETGTVMDSTRLGMAEAQSSHQDTAVYSSPNRVTKRET